MDQGELAVEDLTVGMLVRTLDHGLQPIRWIGSKAAMANGKLRSVRVLAGALGLNLPAQDLLVSRQHRVMVSSRIAERMFGSKDVLIPAIKLTELPGVFTDESAQEVTYFHILFDQHEVIFAEGAPTESLFTGPEALKAVSPDARTEIQTIFPELRDMEYSPIPVRLTPSLKQQKSLWRGMLPMRKHC